MRRFSARGASGWVLGLFILWIVCLLVLFSISARADVIFRDDFNGNSLDPAKWTTDHFFLERTDFNKGATVSGGNATIRLDTYNPAAPGVSFSGSQISTQTIFDRGSGLEFESRFRVPGPIQAGIVAAFFPYHFNPLQQTQDEIDFELLTNWFGQQPNPSAILLTTWNNWDFNPSHGNDGIHMATSAPTVFNWDPTQYNTYVIRWLPDRVEWLINGITVWVSTNAVADEPMPLKLDIWGPSNEFAAAYSSSLQPVGSAAANQSYVMDVDYVEIRSIPETTSLASFVVGLIVMAAIIRKKSKGDEKRDDHRCKP